VIDLPLPPELIPPPLLAGLDADEDDSKPENPSGPIPTIPSRNLEDISVGKTQIPVDADTVNLDAEFPNKRETPPS
jgi:hypothetical protein